jgi:cyclic-di-AMP phosphodiesterase PgpH
VVTDPPERPGAFGRRDAARLLLAGLVILLAMSAGLLADLAPTSPAPQAGAVAASAIVAPQDGLIPNPVETAAARDAAAAAVAPQYDFSLAGASVKAAAQVDALKKELATVDAVYEQNRTQAARQIALQTVLPSLASNNRAVLLLLGADRWTLVEQAAESALTQAEQVEIRVIDPVAQQTLVAQYIPASLGLSDSEKQLAIALAAAYVVPNSAYSATLTDQARSAASAGVATVMDSVKAGQVLVDAGHVVTEADMVRIRFYELDHARVNWNNSAAWLLLGALATVLLLAWLWRFRHEYWRSGRTLALIGGTFAVAVLAEKIPGGRAWLPYAIPAAAAGMLLALLLDAGVALAVQALVAIMAGVASALALELTAYVFLGGLAGMLAIGKGERQHPFIQAGLAVALTNLIVVAVYWLLGQHDATGIVQLGAASLGSALLSSVIALGSFAILGNVFGILTPPQLLELANPTQPVLRRLLTETPGTYHHSLMVANLAERGAAAIGADQLLTRVAAYYHDIGKMGNPVAFIENQAGGENVHDQLEPEDSAAILRQHVQDGMDIATRAGLPRPLVNFIPQHHGTAIMGYVYGRAREAAAAPFGGEKTAEGRAAADAVDQSAYRHSGPKPQSREAALIMLADGVEASVRSLSSRDETSIRAMVRRIVSERLDDGQLDECELTIRDLEKVQEAFVAQLLGMYHQRIAYPQSKVVEIESRRERGLRLRR